VNGNFTYVACAPLKSFCMAPNESMTVTKWCINLTRTSLGIGTIYATKIRCAHTCVCTVLLSHSKFHVCIARVRIDFPCLFSKSGACQMITLALANTPEKLSLALSVGISCQNYYTPAMHTQWRYSLTPVLNPPANTPAVWLAHLWSSAFWVWPRVAHLKGSFLVRRAVGRLPLKGSFQGRAGPSP